MYCSYWQVVIYLCVMVNEEGPSCRCVSTLFPPRRQVARKSFWASLRFHHVSNAAMDTADFQCAAQVARRSFPCGRGCSRAGWRPVPGLILDDQNAYELRLLGQNLRDAHRLASTMVASSQC